MGSRPRHEERLVLEARNVSKSFGPTRALTNATFTLERGSIHALLGGNGSGKSTLIKILAGVEHADSGILSIAGQERDLRRFTAGESQELGLHFVHQQTSTFPELSVTENLMIGRGFDAKGGKPIRWARERRRAAALLEHFHIEAHPDQALGELGAARRTMVAIARALQDAEDVSDEVLILDEPTAALPAPEVEFLLDALRKYAAAGQSIVYVTHRLEEVFAVADRATLLRDGVVVDTVSPSDLTHDGLVELIMGRTVEQVARLRGQAEGGPVLEISDLASGPVRDFDLRLCEGEIVGLAGLIGSGRSTVLKSIFGLSPIEDGEILIDAERADVDGPHQAMAAGIAFVPEDRQRDAAFAELSVGENLAVTVIPQYWRGGFLRSGRERRDAADLFDQFLITAQSEEAPLSSLSGGNQQKVGLARWLRRLPRLLLLDEPTQGVDVGARAEIYDLVHRAVSDGAAALIASSDFEELAQVCDRVLVLWKGRVVAELASEALSAETITRAANVEVKI
jgi:ribose transport system ATP-binding protein